VVAVGGAGATLTLDRTPCFTYSINRGASAARWGYIGDAAVSDLTIQPAPGKQAVWANHALNCVAERLVVDGGGSALWWTEAARARAFNSAKACIAPLTAAWCATPLGQRRFS